jgi:hypothetical protein
MLKQMLRSFLPSRQGRPADVYVVSFPKSGRTWHRILLGNYLAREADVDLRESMKLNELCLKLGKPTFAYSHNGANFKDHKHPLHPDVADNKLWRDQRVILLLRDVRDILTSAYFHARYRRKTFHGSIGEFVRNPLIGAEKVLTAYNKWKQNIEICKDCLVLSYEGLHRDTGGCLTRTLEFGGHGDVNKERVAQSVEFCRPENMRELERINYFNSLKLKPGKDKSSLGAKVRTAKVGDYTNHLTPDDVAFIEGLEEKIGNPFKMYTSGG